MIDDLELISTEFIEYLKKERGKNNMIDYMDILGDELINKIIFIDEATNLECFITRQQAGHLCGYVILPPEHPLHGKDYTDPIFNTIDVHGGLTYGGNHQPIGKFALGFDCAHAGDLSPFLQLQKLNPFVDVYRNITYVKEECRKLARQLQNIVNETELLKHTKLLKHIENFSIGTTKTKTQRNFVPVITIGVTVFFETNFDMHIGVEYSQVDKLADLLEQEMRNAANKLIGTKE